MTSEKQRKTFLSYSRVNRDFAVRLAKELKSEGFDIWLDQLDIPAGARWDREVEKALQESDIFMIILTTASVDSENVLDEIGYAIDNSKRFLPVLLEPCNVPLRLRRFQYVDFTNKGFDEGVESAKELLRSLIAQPTIPRGMVVADLQAEAERKAKEEEESDRLAAKKAEEERDVKVEAETKAKEEADRLAAQMADEERVAIAKIEADRKAKEESDYLAAKRAEEDRLARQKAEEKRKIKEDADRAAKLEADRKAKEEAERLAAQKTEAERVAKAKAEADRKTKEESERLAARKAEAERVAKAKAEEERVAKAKVEADRKAKEEADRKTKEMSADVPPITRKSEPVSSPPITQKKSMSKGLVYGIVGAIAVVVIGISFGVTSILSSGSSDAQLPASSADPVEKTLPTQNVVIEPTNTSNPAPTKTPTALPSATLTKPPTKTMTPTSVPVVDIIGVYDVYAVCGDYTTTGSAEISRGTGNTYNIVFNYSDFSDSGTGEWDGEKFKVWYPDREALQTFIVVPGNIFILRGTYFSGGSGCLWSDDLVKRY